MTESISFNNVGKTYNLVGGYRGLRTVLEQFSDRIRGKEVRGTLQALRSVTFSIQEGEAVAFIGPNGAGKTTILKIISRTSLPTAGKVTVIGKVTALIEVFAGFHSDLTANENIHLYCAVLGMKKKEIAAKFDELVEFSGLSKFLDVPLKRLSLGMQMRLGLSCILHSSPDILLVDETIAVGDLEFMEKSFRRIHSMNEDGVTVVIVTQLMDVVRAFARRTIYLKNGSIVFDGDTNTAISRYVSERTSGKLHDYIDLSGGRHPGKIESLTRVNSDSSIEISARNDEPIEISASCQIHSDSTGLEITVCSIGEEKLVVMDTSRRSICLPRGKCEVRLWIERLPLTPGVYTLRATLFDTKTAVRYGYCDRPLRISGESNTGGHLSINHSWSVRPI